MVGAGSTVPVSVSAPLGLESTGDAPAVPPQPPPAAVLRVPSVLEPEDKAANPSANVNANGNATGNSPPMRVPPRAPPSQSEPVVVVRPPPQSMPHQHHHTNIPPPVSDAAIPLVPSVPPIPTADVYVSPLVTAHSTGRDQSFRVRTALTKGWRKGKKTRKSVGGGRGPGFTSREVDGLLDLLEDAVPVTREEWEHVRGRHAGRFPGTSRSIDSIRRKFAKVYLARGSNGIINSNTPDGNTAPVVRRAKLIRERMAARAVSLDDEDAGLDPTGTGNNDTSAVGHVEAMDTTGMQDDDDDADHHLADNEGNATNVGVAEQVLDAVPSAVPPAVAAASGLAPVPMSMVVNELGATANGVAPIGTDPSAAVPINVEVEPADENNNNVSPRPPPRKRANVNVNNNQEEDMLSVFKMYMEQESQSREEERRIRAEERQVLKTENKAREEREIRRHEQLMQILMVLAQNKQTRDS